LAVIAPLMRAFDQASPISFSGICWLLVVLIYLVELILVWPTAQLVPYALTGPVQTMPVASPQDWIPRSRTAMRPRRSQGMFGGGWQAPHRQVRFGRTQLR
jgi:hypothetical protein